MEMIIEQSKMHFFKVSKTRPYFNNLRKQIPFQQ